MRTAIETANGELTIYFDKKSQHVVLSFGGQDVHMTEDQLDNLQIAIAQYRIILRRSTAPRRPVPPPTS